MCWQEEEEEARKGWPPADFSTQFGKVARKTHEAGQRPDRRGRSISLPCQRGTSAGGFGSSDVDVSRRREKGQMGN